jgi:hypothetical protein
LNLLNPFINSSVTEISKDGIEKMKAKFFVDKNDDEAKKSFINAINNDFDSKLGKICDWHHENNIKRYYAFLL